MGFLKSFTDKLAFSFPHWGGETVAMIAIKTFYNRQNIANCLHFSLLTSDTAGVFVTCEGDGVDWLPRALWGQRGSGECLDKMNIDNHHLDIILILRSVSRSCSSTRVRRRQRTSRWPSGSCSLARATITGGSWASTLARNGPEGVWCLFDVVMGPLAVGVNSSCYEISLMMDDETPSRSLPSASC